LEGVSFRAAEVIAAMNEFLSIKSEISTDGLIRRHPPKTDRRQYIEKFKVRQADQFNGGISKRIQSWKGSPVAISRKKLFILLPFALERPVAGFQWQPAARNCSIASTH
jgi:hypothetical protein